MASRLVRGALRLLEKTCCRFATHVLAANESHRIIERERYGTPLSHITVVRNGTVPDDVHDVSGREALREGASLVIGYAGIIGRQDGVDHLVRAVHHLVHDLRPSDVLCLVVGAGDGLDRARHLAVELGVDDRFRFTGFVPYEELLVLMATVDICVEPAPSNPYNDRSTAVKLMEYMLLGKPVVAFDLPEHRATADDAIRYAPASDDLALAKAIDDLAEDRDERSRLATAARSRAMDALRWDRSVARLLDAYEAIAGAPTR